MAFCNLYSTTRSTRRSTSTVSKQVTVKKIKRNLHLHVHVINLSRHLDARFEYLAYFPRIFLGITWGSKTSLKCDSALTKSTVLFGKAHFCEMIWSELNYVNISWLQVGSHTVPIPRINQYRFLAYMGQKYARNPCCFMRGIQPWNSMPSSHTFDLLEVPHPCGSNCLKYARNRHCLRPDLKPENMDIIELRSDHFAEVCSVKQKRWFSQYRTALQTGLRPPCNVQKYAGKLCWERKTSL